MTARETGEPEEHAPIRMRLVAGNKTPTQTHSRKTKQKSQPNTKGFRRVSADDEQRRDRCGLARLSRPHRGAQDPPSPTPLLLCPHVGPLRSPPEASWGAWACTPLSSRQAAEGGLWPRIPSKRGEHRSDWGTAGSRPGVAVMGRSGGLCGLRPVRPQPWDQPRSSRVTPHGKHRACSGEPQRGVQLPALEQTKDRARGRLRGIPECPGAEGTRQRLGEGQGH